MAPRKSCRKNIMYNSYAEKKLKDFFSQELLLQAFFYNSKFTFFELVKICAFVISIMTYFKKDRKNLYNIRLISSFQGNPNALAFYHSVRNSY